MNMNIVAVSAEPEFVTVEATDGGGIDLTIELARMQVTGLGLAPEHRVGSIQLQLLAADVDTITRRLGEIVMEQAHSIRTEELPQYEWLVKFRNDRMGFVKTKTVQAINDRQAREFAFFALKGDGYEPADFQVVSAERGRQQGT